MQISSGLKIFMNAFSALAIVAQLVYACLLFRYWDKPVIKASSPRMLILLLVGSVCVLVTVFVLGDGSEQMCQSIPFLGGCGITVMLSCLLATNFRIDQIFSSTSLRVTKITDNQLLLMIVALLAMELVIDIVWIAVDPLKPVDVLLSGSDFMTFSSCTTLNTFLWYALYLGYKFVLALYLVFLATKTRNVPSMFNEAKSLALVVYNLTLFSLILVPMVLLLGQKLDAQYALSCLGLIYLSISTTSLVLLPKFLNAQQNTVQKAINATQTQSRTTR